MIFFNDVNIFCAKYENYNKSKMQMNSLYCEIWKYILNSLNKKIVKTCKSLLPKLNSFQKYCKTISKNKKVIIVTDQNIKNDMRSEYFIKEYKLLGYGVDVLNINNYRKIEKSKKNRLILLNLLIMIYRGIKRIRYANFIHIYKKNYKREHVIFRGSKIAIKKYLKLIKLAQMYYEIINKYDIIHANDLEAATLATLVINKDSNLLYDSHELQLYRNRKNGILRCLLDGIIESACVNCAQTIYLVSHPIKIVYEKLYGAQNYKVVKNNFYFDKKHTFLSILVERFEKVNIVYIGSANHNRGIEFLIDIANTRKNINIYLFLNNKKSINKFVDERKTNQSNIYICDIINNIEYIVPSCYPTVGWCYFSKNFLSYRYALPNKFFNYISYNLPIITNKGTYISTVSQINGIGWYIEKLEQQYFDNLLYYILSYYDKKQKSVILYKKKWV